MVSRNFLDMLCKIVSWIKNILQYKIYIVCFFKIKMYSSENKHHKCVSDGCTRNVRSHINMCSW